MCVRVYTCKFLCLLSCRLVSGWWVLKRSFLVLNGTVDFLHIIFINIYHFVYKPCKFTKSNSISNIARNFNIHNSSASEASRSSRIVTKILTGVLFHPWSNFGAYRDQLVLRMRKARCFVTIQCYDAITWIMSVFHDEIEIEDFEYDPELETYFYPCPCGDQFQITKVRSHSMYPFIDFT